MAENIKKGVDLFGLLGTLEAGGGGGSDYVVEKHVVTFAEEITCAKGASVDLCDTAIQTPLCLGMVTYADNAKGNAYVPILSFGAHRNLTGVTSTSGYACATTSRNYTSTSTGYVMLYGVQQGYFNSKFSNGLFVENGKLWWSNKAGLGYNASSSARFLSGSIYIFFILGASA